VAVKIKKEKTKTDKLQASNISNQRHKDIVYEYNIIITRNSGLMLCCKRSAEIVNRKRMPTPFLVEHSHSSKGISIKISAEGLVFQLHSPNGVVNPIQFAPSWI